MVELKQLTIGHTNALGISIMLPRGTISMILKENMIVCDSAIDIEALVSKYPQICIIQSSHGPLYQDILEGHIIHCSKEAIKQGVCLEMKIYDALTLL
ncbi:MAG: hypothetical protein E7191_04965 [Erysipelotrichaceae bacterium]|nr:hypothetical protein [Erysipelotrichaceae bacterium]MBQ9988104.1 hypothetical protein [Erysipelotrichales bacterium]